MRLTPRAKSAGWLWQFLVYGAALSALIALNRFVALGKPFDGELLLRFAVLSFGLAAAANGLGWLGGRLAYLFTTAGIVVGVVLMFVYANRNMDGWEDLAGVLAFAEAAAFGIAIGLIAELARWLWKLRR
ncbi:hypothetical protein [Paenibacillus sp. GYB003]|uniref:hypothetical protein n=1 Tax=Paenibacillus sp. GYB003 TaxID=2994392 RepID=UPI002F964797